MRMGRRRLDGGSSSGTCVGLDFFFHWRWMHLSLGSAMGSVGRHSISKRLGFLISCAFITDRSDRYLSSVNHPSCGGYN